MRTEGTSVFGLEQQPTVGTKINFNFISLEKYRDLVPHFLSLRVNYLTLLSRALNESNYQKKLEQNVQKV